MILLWYENYHISLVANPTREIFIFIPLDENKSRISTKKLYLYIALEMLVLSINMFKLTKCSVYLICQILSRIDTV